MKILIKLSLSSLILGFFSGVVSGLGLLCVCVVVCSVSLWLSCQYSPSDWLERLI